MEQNKGPFTYAEDVIVSDKTKTVEEKIEILQRKRHVVTTRMRRLKELGLTPRKLEEERQFIIDVFPDANLTEIASYREISYVYIRSRYRELKKLGTPRKKTIATEEDIEYILQYKTLIPYDEIAEIRGLNRNLVAIIVDIHEKREKSREIKKQIEKRGFKKELPRYMPAPIHAISIKDIEKMQYKKGVKYEIVQTQLGKGRERQHFKGKLLQEYKYHILMKNETGRRESFLKVDFLTGQARIKEVV